MILPGDLCEFCHDDSPLEPSIHVDICPTCQNPQTWQGQLHCSARSQATWQWSLIFVFSTLYHCQWIIVKSPFWTDFISRSQKPVEDLVPSRTKVQSLKSQVLWKSGFVVVVVAVGGTLVLFVSFVVFGWVFVWKYAQKYIDTCICIETSQVFRCLIPCSCGLVS